MEPMSQAPQVSNALPVVPRQPVVQGELAEIMRLAVERGDIAVLEKLVALKERVEDRNAASEFTQALAAFQAECPPIQKKSEASIVTRSGGSYKYRYAELDHIARVTRPVLVKHGFSYTWDSEMQGAALLCTCHLHHIGGHSRSAKFVCPTDSASAMSSQQRHAAALTFSKRQSLIAVLGLTTTDADTDGASPEPISEEQVLQIDEWLSLLDEDRRLRFLKYMGVAAVSTIKATDFDKAITSLRAVVDSIDKAKGKAKGGAA